VHTRRLLQVHGLVAGARAQSVKRCPGMQPPPTARLDGLDAGPEISDLLRQAVVLARDTVEISCHDSDLGDATARARRSAVFPTVIAGEILGISRGPVSGVTGFRVVVKPCV